MQLDNNQAAEDRRNRLSQLSMHLQILVIVAALLLSGLQGLRYLEQQRTQRLNLDWRSVNYVDQQFYFYIEPRYVARKNGQTRDGYLISIYDLDKHVVLYKQLMKHPLFDPQPLLNHPQKITQLQLFQGHDPKRIQSNQTEFNQAQLVLADGKFETLQNSILRKDNAGLRQHNQILFWSCYLFILLSSGLIFFVFSRQIRTTKLLKNPLVLLIPIALYSVITASAVVLQRLS
ncbi:hypothetical protein LVY74_11130 [Acinetobacter sp. ME22]|uniref:hypothetical protein n=1 Tax=Acinetobacter sp. ME22 TaxID=2904802 RepID=UPI001EDC3E08|nr:hypothetical protein [Acinetobacter sp. ME22]MCG2574102.1 hypothetical protein [Acinetobacter sp. ME22]